MAARDVNLRLYIEDGASNWIPAVAGDFVGVKLIGTQSVGGLKTWEDAATFEDSVYINGGALAALEIDGPTSNALIFGRKSSAITFQDSAGAAGLSVVPSTVNAGSTLTIPEISASASTDFILQETAGGQQYINDDINLSGAVSFMDSVTFVDAAFSFDTNSLTSLGQATAGFLVNTYGVQAIAGAKTINSIWQFNNDVSFEGEETFNGPVIYNSDIEFAAGADFSFNSVALASFATAAKGSVMTLGDFQTVTSAKIWNAGQTFQSSTVFANNNVDFSASSIGISVSSFVLDSSSATSLALQLGQDLADLTSNQDINGYKIFSKVGLNPPVAWSDTGMDLLASGNMRFYFDDNSGFEFSSTALDAFIDAVKSELVTVDDSQDILANKTFQADAYFAGAAAFDGAVSFAYPSAPIVFFETDFDLDSSSKDNLVANVGLVDLTNAQTINGNKTFGGALTTINTLGAGNASIYGTVYTDYIREYTLDEGIDIDSLFIKDGEIILKSSVLVKAPSPGSAIVSFRNQADTDGAVVVAKELSLSSSLSAVGGITSLTGLTSPSATLTAGKPATPTSTGTVGEVRVEADYIYVCVSTNVWRRVLVDLSVW